MKWGYIFIAVALGIIAGTYFSTRREIASRPSQREQKKVNKKEVLKLFARNEKVTNDDVQEMLGVSDATATRYLDQLENAGKIEQVGETGKGVYYILK